MTAKAQGGSSERPLTASVEGAAFNVGPLLPGEYVVSAAHPHWSLAPSSISHTLSLAQPQLPQGFAVAGYRLRGAVTSKSGPVAGIQVCGCVSTVSAKEQGSFFCGCDLRVQVSCAKLCTAHHRQSTPPSITPIAQVTLLSEDDTVRAGCSKAHPPGAVSMADIETALSSTPLCSVTTDAAGQYSFSGTPCGQYRLQVCGVGAGLPVCCRHTKPLLLP